MMSPTIGRLVHYYWCTADTEQLVPILGSETEPYAAMVASTSDGDTVDLWLFPKPGDAVRHTAGARISGAKYSVAPKAGHWCWPPMAKPGAYVAPEHCPDEAATVERT